jgi:hypothetical protein
MKTNLTRFGLFAGSVLAAASLVACGGGGDSSSSTNTGTTPTATLGSLSVALTDAPACGFDAVNVTVTKIRVNKSATAADTDSSWVDFSLSPARKINLLSLTNGVLDTLGQGSLDPGHYSQIRLVLDANASGTANTVIPTGSTQEVALDTPSAVQSGLKLNGEFDVTAGALTSLVIDFNACKSVLKKGNAGYALKPVLTLVPAAQNGISGVIAPGALTHHVMISAEQNGQIVASTTPDQQTGVFLVSHLAAGNYDLVITSDNTAASVIGTVPVTATGTTSVSSAAAPLSLAASSTGSISGTVTLSPASSTEAAYVAAKQTLGTGPTVTIKYQGADITTGAYAITGLPLAAPQYAAYSATLPLAFSAATGVTAGVYSVDASANGYTTKSAGTVDISGGSKSGVNITLTP